MAASAVLQLQSFLICIYPFSFLEMDGYHVLEDAVGMPRLAQESSQFVRGPVWKRLASGQGFNRQEIVYVLYFTLSLLSVVGVVGLNAWLILRQARLACRLGPSSLPPSPHARSSSAGEEGDEAGPR